MFDPDKWAEKTENRLKQRADNQAHEKEESLQQEKIFDDESTQLWQKVREAFKQLCDAYNKRQEKDLIFFGDIGQFVFSIRHSDVPGGADVLVERTLGRRHEITVRISNRYYQIYKPQLFDEGPGSVTLVSSQGAPTTPEEIASSTLEKFLDS